jgi:transcription elongation factor GreA
MVDKDDRVPVTAEGLRKLQEELDYLTKVRRPEVAQHIADAKADGDISENAGYDEAKNEQAFVEGRILTVEALLRRAVLIEDVSSDHVDIGTLVTIREQGCTDEECYLIVGSAEADPAEGRISNVSPMGRALLGKAIGDQVVVRSPGGDLRFEVLGISLGTDLG